MKYALQCLMRFKTAQERDKAYDYLGPRLQKQYKKDDCYLEKYKCYHDEDPVKPCEQEGEWTPLPYLPATLP